ncbi:MAG: nicotinate (nicotinamide) nucleotide adenylyltransferase [Clostridia bacterium]|nr:nicotinate (nicotinamide) nucleotide adenylyltransferase [Clostridia bacterium]
MRVGIFGGTFDPPHLGHINMCEAFLKKISLDKLYVIPAHIPPHKTIKSMTSVNERFEMAKLAFSSISDKVIISDIEIIREGKSYTADTLRSFREQGFNDLYFLCGTDMLLTLDKWYNPEYIFESATIVCVRRENETENDLLIKDKVDYYTKKYNARIIILDVDAIEISSSEIREAIKNNNNICSYLTNEIENYIKANNLYKDE